ncbi:hypothetical protein NEMIN01_1530 [Nematocida minor]|uniref:uncharacterized protein n=1 Tax=Nematocida minor TaxID=1912983 RepID=UPI00221EE328|nr:uncharacterized protein NEMIN01_1530 [Nematocida minor]KAI5191504.1 hypothetical protein NEMIN01_1530 [Nematocida minor]
MQQHNFPTEIIEEQNAKTNILYDLLDSSLHRILLIIFTFIGFVTLFVLANILICILVIYIKG